MILGFEPLLDFLLDLSLCALRVSLCVQMHFTQSLSTDARAHVCMQVWHGMPILYTDPDGLCT